MLNKVTRFLLVVGVFVLTTQAMAQQDPEARRVLDAMSNKYRTVSSFSADLRQDLDNTGSNISESMSGTIAVKGDMFRINMGGQEIANNGEKVFVYLEEVDEITVDFFYPEEADITPSKIFDLYKEGYKYTKLPDETVNGKSCHIIDLIPEDASGSSFYRIRLAVDKSNLLLQRYQMWDRSNTVYSYALTNVKLNANLSDAMFVLNSTTHPGAAVVDLTN